MAPQQPACPVCLTPSANISREKQVCFVFCSCCGYYRLPVDVLEQGSSHQKALPGLSLFIRRENQAGRVPLLNSWREITNRQE